LQLKTVAKKEDLFYYERRKMGQKEKLIARLETIPRDFTFDEAETLLGYFGYYRCDKGKTSGSRVVFVNAQHKTKILLHKPHPKNVLREYQIKQIIFYLKQEELI
jgi:hypothetical protein